MIDSHAQEGVIESLKQQPLQIREQVSEVSVDMWGGFPKVVREVFPNAKLVVDRFHVMQALTKELNVIRKQTRVTEKGARFLILKNRVDLEEADKEKLDRILKRSRRLKKAYELKEDFRAIYEKQLTVEEGARQFKQWLRKARQIYGGVISTIRSHLPEICNYFQSRTTNGAMEGINNRIKLIKRQAYGFTNFNNFRMRLLACFSNKEKLSPC